MASYSNSTSNETLVHEAPCFIHDANVVRAFRVAPFASTAFCHNRQLSGFRCIVKKQNNEENY